MKAPIATTKSLPKKTNKQSFIQPKETTDFYTQSQEATPLFIQPKLIVGQSNDKYEKEADAMGDKMINKSKENVSISKSISLSGKMNPAKNTISTNASTNKLQRKEEEEKKPSENQQQVQLKSSSNSNKNSVPHSFESKLQTSKGNGATLNNSVKTEMESGFGRSFDDVRVHTGTNAVQMSKDIGAKAFTNGNNIYFNNNNYNPTSNAGKRLLAHELTHVVQQKSSSNTIQKEEEPTATTANPPQAANTQQTEAAFTSAASLGGQVVKTNPLLSTRTGPGSRVQDVSIIIGPTTKIRNIGTVLLPLWNTATPFTAPGATAPNPIVPLTAEELAKGLLIYNRYRLAIPPAATPAAMTNWKIGMRFPLPIRIDTTTNEGVLHFLTIRGLASGFDASWNHLLDELPQLIANVTPVDLRQQAQDFLTATPDVFSRGMSLMAKATRNAVANEQLITEVFDLIGTGNSFAVGLSFMTNAINRDILLLANQQSGARILAKVSASLASPPTGLSADQQRSLQRAQHMLGLVSSVEAEAQTEWTATTADERMVYVMRLLVDQYNFPINGAAGLVGNLYSESGVLPNRVEGSAITTPMRARNDGGRTTDFTPTQIMNRSSIGRAGPDKPGIGLAQWTSSDRREGLFEHSFRGRQDGEDIIFNMEAQVSYLVNELIGSYNRVYVVLTRNNVSVNDASDEVIYNFEIPSSVLSGKSKLPRSNSQVQTSFRHRRNQSNRALRVYNESL